MYSTTTLEGPHYSISFENTFMKIGISLEINDKTFDWPNQMPWILTWKAVCDIQQQQLWFSIFPHPDSVTYIFIHPFSILFNLSSDSKMRTNNWKWVITGEFPHYINRQGTSCLQHDIFGNDLTMQHKNWQPWWWSVKW